MTIVHGRRQTTADAYLRPVLSRANLSLQLGAHVHRLSVEADRCTGVEYSWEGQSERAHAAAEVVLCAGTIDSPRLLLLSGIGDPAELAGLGIEAVAELPGVGHNLHDHILLRGICVRAKQPIPAGTGNLGEAVLYWRSEDGRVGPDLQIVLIYAPFRNPWQPAHSNAYAFAVAHMRPASRGKLTLASSDPRQPPRIDFNYLGERYDVEMMVRGVEKALELRTESAFADWRERDAMSGIESGRSQALSDFVKQGVATFSHAVGTCRMGVDDGAVVDSQLKVRGVDGLRIADASIMPSITSTNTNAATIMIGEKAVDLLLGRAMT